jgi:glycosidase
MYRSPFRKAIAIVLVVVVLGAALDGQTARADSIDTASLFFDGHNTFYRSPFGAVTSGSAVQMRFRTAHQGATAVTVILTDQSASPPSPRPLSMTIDSANSTGQYDVWQATLSLPNVGFWTYYFEIQNGTAQTYYADLGLLGFGAAGTSTDFLPPASRQYKITVYESGFTVPSWLTSAVMYQIFPDRFYNGDKTNDTKVLNPAYTFRAKIFKNWNTPESTLSTPDNDYNQLDYYGGDLQGIIDKLPYLKGLGVNVLYLNPIFHAGTNHGYDTANYRLIAPHLGTLKTFKTLITDAHKDHMRVILDGVFNHSSSDSIYFNRYGHFAGTGAYQSQSSPYYTWYTFQRWPDQYSSYFGIDTLPQLSEIDAVKSFIYRDANSIAQYWLNMGADGWRLDHAVGKSDSWWQEFRTDLKRRFPNDALICECDNSAPTYGINNLFGNMFDGQMNYPFRSIALSFYARGIQGISGRPFTATQFLNAIVELAAQTPRPAEYASMNVIGTHDTDRALDLVNDRVAEMKQLAAFQMAWLGMPEIYYGDEAGLTGSGSPDTVKRKPFPWSHPNKRLQSFYRKIIHLRDANAALQDGSVTPLLSDDTNRVVAFLRQDAKQAIPVVVNDGTSAQTVAIPTTGLKSGAKLVDGISGRKYTVTGATLSVHLAATSTAILVPQKAK